LPHLRVLSGQTPGSAEALHSTRNRRRGRTRGGATLELALLSPWVFFLFIGALDWGFYGYSLISLQAAARSAALYTSKTTTTAIDSGTACNIVLGELRSLSNIGTSTTTCTSNPVVTATQIVGPDSAAAAQVSVQYRTPSMIPIPGLLAKQFTITRVVKMRIRG
jgi:Flp pilus assembly protein TadG